MGETLFFPPHKKHISGFVLPDQQKVLSEDETEDWGALPHPPSQETCVKEVILWMYTYTALSVTLRTVCPVALTTFSRGSFFPSIKTSDSLDILKAALAN